MKAFIRHSAAALVLLALASQALPAQDNGGVRRRTSSDTRRRPGTEQASTPEVSARLQQRYDTDGSTASDADLQWMRVIYRQLDVNQDPNAALYFPEEPVEGNENLFRIIMRLLANNQVAAYEYLDGREVFSDEYRVNVRDMLDRFHILHTDAKGSTERNPRFVIAESDVPSNEVLSYYIIERWEYDTRSNRLRPHVEAICPVLHRSGDFGGEAVRYPMFWLRYRDIRPWLTQQTIFINDDNNLPTCTYDDFFTQALYNGEIYKTRNLRNRSLMQMYPNPDERRRVQDSIQARLDSFENKLWVPSREEIIAAREAREAAEAGDSTIVRKDNGDRSPRVGRSTRRGDKKPARKPKVSKQRPQKSSSSATRSVRRRK